MISAVAYRYARALADAVLNAGSRLSPQQAISELESMEAAMQESPALRHVLDSPAVQPGPKRAVIDDLARPLALSGLTRNFLLVLVKHHRIRLLTETREAFEAEIDERLGFARAEVSSARELAREQVAAIESGLASLTGKQVRARFRVDPSLIGGVVARIGSTVYDGSIRGQLESLRRKIAQGASAGI